MRVTATAGEPSESSSDNTGRSSDSMADSARLGPSVDSMAGIMPSSTSELASICWLEGLVLPRMQSSAREHFHGYVLLLVQ